VLAALWAQTWLPRPAPTATRCCLSTSSTHSIGPNLNPRMPYDAVRDFTPIAHLGNAPSIMLVPNNSPAKTVKEWVDYAKKNPGRLNYASSGNGTIVQLSAELFKAQADVFVVHIPYKGTALAIPDLISGKVDVLFDSLPTGMPHVRDGRLRALGVTTLKPTALAPGIPAIADVLPGYESNTWFGFFGPKNLPPEVVSRINTAANQVLKDPEVTDKLLRFGIEPIGGTPAQFTTMLASESAKWKKIITERKITLD
jgi:tripartite-type tricarboxylate transporter receptor subunit TctC